MFYLHNTHRYLSGNTVVNVFEFQNESGIGACILAVKNNAAPIQAKKDLNEYAAEYGNSYKMEVYREVVDTQNNQDYLVLAPNNTNPDSLKNLLPGRVL